jgi:phosphoribosylformylglycinamidine synthase
MIGMVGKMDDVRSAKPAVITKPSYLLLLHNKAQKFFWGGSLVAKVLGLNVRDGDLVNIDYEAEKEAFDFMLKISSLNLIDAARDVAGGGVAVSVAKMCLGGNYGFELKTPQDNIESYFAEVAGSYVIAVNDNSNIDKIKNLASSLKFNEVNRVGYTSIDFNEYKIGSSVIKQENIKKELSV